MRRGNKQVNTQKHIDGLEMVGSKYLVIYIYIYICMYVCGFVFKCVIIVNSALR